MKLYYMPGACSLASHIVLEWIGQPYEAERMARDALKTPDFLRLNPAGSVPVIQDGGWTLTQNSAILNYLADSHPEAGLGGDGTPKARAEINRWLGFINSDMHPAFKPLFGSTGYLDDAAVQQTKERSKQMLRKHFETVDAHLEGRDWLGGARSIADPYLYVLLRWARAMRLDLTGLDNLARFVERMDADASVQAALAAEKREEA